MQELEKILEDIEKLKEMYKESSFALLDKGNLPCEYDKSDIESAKVQAISESIAIIRKHMNDEKCGECSRRKWYQKGYEDGKKNGGWISVDDRLPEEGQEVWISVKTDCVRMGMYTKCFGFGMRKGFICSDGFMCIGNVLAWKPFVYPEPYRPERSDNHDGE